MEEEQEIEDISLTANALKAMAHPIRWRILCILGTEELTVRDIVEKVGSSQSNISQHLEILRNKHIITSRRDGNRIFCKVKNQHLLKLIQNMRGVLCQTNLSS